VITAGLDVQRDPSRQHGTPGRRISGRKGQRIRARILARDPICVLCKQAGRVAVSSEVDHVLPLSKGGTYDDDNMMGLCGPCHKAKTTSEASGKPRIGIDGVPVDGSWK
jgi:5-methylcytosine-specific restriction protein A